MQPDPHAQTLAEAVPKTAQKAGASLLGRVLKDSYRVDSILGQGAMGTVYRGTQIGLEKPVAIKVIRSDGFDSPDAHDRFQREATLVSKLLHPGIAQVLDFGFEDDMPFLVMEFVEGKELTEVMAKEGPMPPARALQIIRQLASALGEAHARGVVHRDIKPQNLRLMRYTPGGQIFLKVLDFGIAKQIGEGSEKGKLTATGAVIGTPMYMAPEQASGTRIDPRADQYAVGVVLYELLTGTVPFTGETLTGVLMSHLTQPPPPLPRQVPEPLQRIVMRLLGKVPDARYPDMAALDAALAACEAACRDVAPLSVGKVQPHTAGGITVPSSSWRPTILIGGGAVLIAAAVLGGVLLLGLRAQQQRDKDKSTTAQTTTSTGAKPTTVPSPSPTAEPSTTTPPSPTAAQPQPEPGIKPTSTPPATTPPGPKPATGPETAGGAQTGPDAVTKPAASGPATSPVAVKAPQPKPVGNPAPAAESPEIKEKLDEAESAIKGGDFNEAVRLARQANSSAPSARGFRILTEAHCRQGSFDAKAPFFRVAKADRARLVTLCKQHDVDLTSQ